MQLHAQAWLGGKMVTALTETAHELSGLVKKDHDATVGSTNLKSSRQQLTEKPRKWSGFRGKLGLMLDISLLRSECMSQRGEVKGKVVTKKHREEKRTRDRMLVIFRETQGERNQHPVKEEAICYSDDCFPTKGCVDGTEPCARFALQLFEGHISLPLS